LAAFSGVFPRTWKRIDEYRRQLRHCSPRHPDWCFLPLAGIDEVALGVGPHGRLRRPVAAILGALSAWRATQGIYRFDPTVMDEVWSTPIEGDLPNELLHHLPEWCPYILTPGRHFMDMKLHGFFAHLDYDTRSGRTDLRLVLDVTTEPCDDLVPLSLHLVPGGLGQALSHGRAGGLKELADDPELAEYLQVSREEGWDPSLSKPIDFTPTAMGSMGWDHNPEDYEPLVALVLFLCSLAEIRDAAGSDRQPARPEMRNTGRGLRAPVPGRPTEWQVAYRLGAALRRAHAAGGVHAEDAGEPRSRMPPHYRRAHWHSFWAGPRAQPEKRRLVLRWLPPIAVNVTDPEQLVPAVRPVA
jgi:hypothetical protein